MKLRLIVFSILFLLINSCGFKKFGEWDISELYSQKIEGTSKILYKYEAWGGRDSHVSGFLILDSDKTFKIDLPNTLPFYKLSDIPNKSKIEGIMHECFNSCGDGYYKAQPIFTPIKINNTESNNLKIETIIFQYRGYSERDRNLESYEFEKFVETKDSLYFYNLDDVESMNGIHLDELRIKKGEIYLQENEKGEIIKIVAKQKTLDNTTKEILEGRICYLKPKNKILTTDFSERGIFRQVKPNK